MKIRKYILTAAALFLTACLCTACGNGRKEEQGKLRQQGITHLENGDYEEALAAFQEALDLSLGRIGETELDICFYKAQAQYKTGDTDGALDTYTAIIDYNKSSKAYFLRGSLYYGMADEENALADYKAAVAKEKKDYELYIGIYEELFAHDKQEEAAAYLNQALTIEGSSAYDSKQKGWIHFLLGDYEAAQELLTEAAQGKENEAYYCLAEVYLAMGDYEAAQDSVNAYITSGAADSYRLYDIAQSQLVKENYEVAITCLEAARGLEKVPNQQSVLKTLVLAYEKNQDMTSACEVLTSYVDLYPDDDEAARELTFLETR